MNPVGSISIQLDQLFSQKRIVHEKLQIKSK